ncbi:phosphoribosylglycinamide formyltransferase [Granulicatella sp. zg-ZJ]|uniref:phosphoribosylglycinamide formyltransferase n=1 Tax=Granulicatella sp. zg-ZJ TaxID=2678504 RepID=UPI0013D1D969|nr:phosphoribosylglycinamide formyltransferase [Granulicatella sp. zg-ZJ]MBS4750387.1 phosphoribosylglycinamide formyltransferase [Carnobacteriaceae bacterium zg-ZUI78]NEW63210.1 phosphoribosylglycinamide formyltransferase [Granulicatella sp. zg-ZJ]
MNLAVFASGNGSNFSALYQAIQEGILKAHISCVICDKKDAYVLERAKQVSVPYYHIALSEYDSKEAYEKAILDILALYHIDYIILAGYMKIIGQTLLDEYSQRILNIHPAYLPEFKGKQGILDAFSAGVSQTGVTVHLVDEGIDTGEIILQERVPVFETDTLESLEERIHAVEHRLYPKAIQMYYQNKRNDERRNV